MNNSTEKYIASFFKDGRITFTDYIPLNILIGFLIQFIWMQLEDMSFLTINSFISIMIPGLPNIIMSVILKLIYFDIFYTERWLPQIMKEVGLNFD